MHFFVVKLAKFNHYELFLGIERVKFIIPQIFIFTFVKERFHNAVEIDILGIFEGYSSLQIWPPKKIFQGRNYSGRMT